MAIIGTSGGSLVWSRAEGLICRSMRPWESPALSEPWLSPLDLGGGSVYLIYILRFANEVN